MNKTSIQKLEELTSFDQGDLQYILLVQYQNQQFQNRQLWCLNVYYCPVENGRVLGFVGFAALGFFFAPGLIGVSSFMGALIGGSIGWRLFGGNRKKNTEDSDTASNVPGFDSAPAPPRLGGVIPLVFTNTDTNNQGSLAIPGDVIYSRIATFNGEQTLYLLRSLGLGEFLSINSDESFINGQLKENYPTDNIFTEYKLGTSTQTPYPQILNYSQVISPRSLNVCAAQWLWDSGSNDIFNGNGFETDEDVTDRFTFGSEYIVNNTRFRITSIDRDNNLVTTNTFLPTTGGDVFYRIIKATYTTTKRCNRIDLNFRCQLFAIDDEGESAKAATVFQLFIDGIYLQNFVIQHEEQNVFRRSLTIQGLSLSKHKIELIPYAEGNEEGVLNSREAIELDDSGILQTSIIAGVTIVYESRNGLITGWISRTNGKDFQTISTTNTPPITLTSVNEIVTPDAIGQSRVTNYKNLVLAYDEIKADPALSGSITRSDKVEKGIKGRQHLFTGLAGSGSTSGSLIDPSANFSFDSYESSFTIIIRNISKKIEANITNFTTTTITSNNLGWGVGDRYLVFFIDSINYFPDLYVYLLLNKETGLGNYIQEDFIDFPSIVSSRAFVKANNFFWDNVITDKIQFDSFVTQESLASTLFPTKFSGNFGLIPEQETLPTGIYSVSNIIPGSFEQSNPDPRTINQVNLTYSALEDDSTRVDTTITVLTNEAAQGIDPLVVESLNYKSITNEAQAITVASRYLKSRRIQDRSIKFSTGIQGFSEKAGNLIIIQYAPMETNAEYSGFCIIAGNLALGVQTIALSKPLKPYINPVNSKVNVYHLDPASNTPIETELDYSLGGNNTITVSGLQETIQPRREGFSGDILIINTNINEKIYRITSIEPRDLQVNITAILWKPEILTQDGLTIIT
jgi:hypothetical protein